MTKKIYLETFTECARSLCFPLLECYKIYKSSINLCAHCGLKVTFFNEALWKSKASIWMLAFVCVKCSDSFYFPSSESSWNMRSFLKYKKVPFPEIKEFFRGFLFLKYKKSFLLRKYKTFFWGLRFLKYKKRFLFRKYKKFF